MGLVRCEEPGCGDWHHPELKGADGTPRCLRHRPGIAIGSLTGEDGAPRLIESGEKVFRDAMEQIPVDLKNLRDENGERIFEE